MDGKLEPGEEYGKSLAPLVALVTFVASWWHCASEYGFLLGFGLGWLPSAILAAMVGGAAYVAWPLTILAVWSGVLYGVAWVLAAFRIV